MADLVQQIDNILPQTQCGDCTFSACLPYARALVAGERLDRCTPGGVDILKKIATILNKDYSPYLESMQKKQTKQNIVQIKEPDCIGCIKCIKACPVDAIIGSRKKMHTIISTECTGCGLCILACPVDCIDEIKVQPTYSPSTAKTRFIAKTKRNNLPNKSITQISNQEKDVATQKQAYINKLLKKNA